MVEPTGATSAVKETIKETKENFSVSAETAAEKTKKTLFSWLIHIKEISLHVPSQETIIFKELSSDNVLSAMRELNLQLMDIEEKRWADAPYAEIGDNIEKTIIEKSGPYRNREEAHVQRHICEFGSNSYIKHMGQANAANPEGGPNPLIENFPMTKIGAFKDNKGKLQIVKIPIPPEKIIYFKDGAKAYFRTYGSFHKTTISDDIKKYDVIYQEKVDEIIEIARNTINPTTDEEKRKLDMWLNMYEKAFRNSVITNGKFIRDYEHYYVSKMTGIRELYQEQISPIRKSFNETIEISKFIKNRVIFNHTYKLISSGYYQIQDKSWKRCSLLDNLREGETFDKYKNEILDEYGMPFEVDNDGTLLADKYKSMLGLLDTNKIRKLLPNEVSLVTDMIPLELMWAYVSNEYDEIRDHMRDGRYARNSLTVLDYIEALRNMMGVKYPFKRKNYTRMGPDITQEEVDEIRKFNFNVNRAPNDEITINGMIRRPSNILPAFDKRAFKNNMYKNWKRLGKIYYYQRADDAYTFGDIAGHKNVRNNIIPGTNERLIDHFGVVTTRGIAMYIIERVIQGVKYYSKAKEILRMIGNKYGGFDYGPRLYGEELPIDPFDINIDIINQDLIKQEQDKYAKKKEQ